MRITARYRLLLSLERHQVLELGDLAEGNMPFSTWVSRAPYSPDSLCFPVRVGVSKGQEGLHSKAHWFSRRTSSSSSGVKSFWQAATPCWVQV